MELPPHCLYPLTLEQLQVSVPRFRREGEFCVDLSSYAGGVSQHHLDVNPFARRMMANEHQTRTCDLREDKNPREVVREP